MLLPGERNTGIIDITEQFDDEHGMKLHPDASDGYKPECSVILLILFCLRLFIVLKFVLFSHKISEYK